MPKVNQSKAIKNTRSQPKRLTEEEIQEQFWDEVDQLSQEKIYQLLTGNIPLPNIELITEPYRYEDKQQKLTGLFLHKDVDYRTLLTDIENRYTEEEDYGKEHLAQEISVEYIRLVIKALIADLSNFASYDPSYFEDLTQE
ncbi:hypothetical protein [endosymbiont GvMRE of Glomus versiforme]|uniref:hypothetical protein n=1 Tax=endosymbiont GvMRE of Glomus versiforme TaxID=2039283 RepID=UPI000EC58FD1|nr:hypothetical protein [endosymbiont GvMRE of Glomus versiforme]RHZ36646.1 hypothetical protein GvMRE_I2g546 [endosymbiont GvMRE of Glomus versiforme]